MRTPAGIQAGPVHVAASSSLRGGLWTLGGDHAVLTGRPVALDVFGDVGQSILLTFKLFKFCKDFL